MATLDDFRQLPQYKDFSDEQLVVTLSQKYGIEPGEIAQEFGVSYNPQRNPLGAGLSAGVDQLQGLGYGAIGAGSRALGAEGVADWADRGVTRNYAESTFNGRSDLERIEYQSLGSALPFLGYQVAKQVPMLAGTLAASAAVPQAAIPAALSRGLAVIPKGLGGGGLKAGMDFAGRRAALEAGNAFGRTIAASYPIGVGAMYGEAVERGDPTQGDALAALGLGVPYGAAEAVMPSMVRNAFGSNAARFAGGLPTRLAKAGGLGFAGESSTELFQNELEMGFAGNLTQDEIDSRRLNSAVIGGLVGGTFNLPAGFRGQRNPADPIDILNRDTAPQVDPAPAAGLNLTNLAVPQQGIFNDPAQVEQWAGIAPAPTAEQHASRAEDILAAFNTPVGEVGGRPVTAWEAFQREQGVPANRIQTGPAQIKEAAPKIDIPVPQPLQSDPVRSAVAQASPATLRKDGTLKDFVEKALGAYSGFSDGEIAAALEEFAASKRKDTVWRVAALEAIARQRAPQGAPNVAQVDAASGQGAGAVPAGSAGNAPSSPGILDGVRRPAGAPAPSSAAGIPVGEPVVQQPAGLTEGAQPTNVPPTQQVAAQAEETRGQEGAQVGAEQSRDAERSQVSRIFDTLSEREREILTKYHFDKMTFEEIGSELKERGESGTTRQRIEQQHKDALRKLAEAGRPFGLTPERLRLYFPDESRRMAGGADVQTASAAEVAQSGAGMTYRDESNNGVVNQANDEFEMTDAVAGAEALDLDTDIAREEFDEGFRGEQGTDVDALEQVEAVESMARTERDHAGREITEEAVRIAGLEYDQDLQEGDVPFAQLDRADQIRYTKAAIAFNDEVLSAQQLMRVFGEIADGARQQASQPQRAVEEAGAVAQVQGAVPARDAGETQQETDTREEVTSTPAFKRWFGDSVVVDARGEPLVVYHGTRGDFSVFSEGEIGSATDRGFAGPAFYFTNNAKSASSYAEPTARNQDASGGNVMPVYLKIERPYYVPEGQDTLTPEQEREAHSGRYDGIINRLAEDDGYVEYAVFRPEQIKSATGNNGQFDGANPDIRYSRTTDTQGTTVEAVRSAINDIATPMGRRKVTVYQTADEAVQNGALNSKDAKGTQGWVDAKGNAFFIAGNIPNGSELAVVLHEIGAHLGIEKLLTDAQYESLVKKIFAWAQSDANTQEARIARAALARVDSAKLENEADLAPETIAYFIEEAVKAGVNPTAMQYKTELGRWFRTLWAAFKVALDRLGLIDTNKLTAQNIVDIAYGAANIALTGDLDPAVEAAAVRYSKTADPQLTELAQETGQRALKAIQAGIRKGWTGLAFSSHLANAAHRAGLTSARALELVQRKKATRAYEIQIEVEKVLSKFADLKGQINGHPAGEVVQRFVYDATFDKKWGFKPDWKDDAVVDPKMESRFKELPADAQAVIKDVFRHGDAIFKEKQDLLRKTITGEYEALIKVETDDGKRRKLERQRDKELREAGRLIAEMNGPYAPLRRYGNYVVVAKSQKYRDAEAAGPVDAKLKRDENHYVVEFAETLYEAERLQGVLEGKFGKGMVWAGEKETATEQFGELPFMAVQRLRKMVDTDLDGDLNTKSKRVLNKLLVDLYISTLHEANARHSEQKRQFVNRADRDTAAKDMMRAFATQGRADSHLVSALQFNSEIVDEMQKLRNEAKNGQGDSLLKTRLRNEILQRHMMDLDFRETPVQDKLMSLNSFWMLLTSPGYYVQNATQVMMMTQPVLAGKFGQNRSMRQLMRGYQDAMRVLKGSSWNEAADLSRFNGTTDEKAMLIELQARGTLDFGISAELGYWESRGEISKVFNQVMRKVGMGTRKLEVLNRMSSALAAYRMMYDQTTGTQAKRHAAALDYADSIIKDTHGDYSTTNAPRYLRMMPKVMTQFRKFQLIQLSLFAKVIHGSVKGANPQEKRAMRAALGYLFMNHALLAGAVGVPASALLGAIYAIAGDDDDPNDWEVDVRRAIGDKEMADLILHGLPSLININMSNKIGAGTMLDPLPFVEYEATRGGYEKAVTAAMGPLIGGLGAQVVDAFGRILKGDVAQGTAQLLPRGFRDAARGFMAAQDGIQLRNGQTALTPEELSFYDSLMMGLGLPTLKTTSRTETQFKSQQYETFFRERVTKLKRQYSEAYEENDREAMLEARQAWGEMQASRKNLGFKVQPLSDLLKAPREKAKAEAKLENGIRTTEQARGFVKSLQ